MVDDVLDGQQDLANSNAIQELQNQLHNYASSVRIGDTEGKISALDSLVTIFQNLRTQPDLFVSESFVQAQPAPYYLLKKAGTNKCFGPRVGKQTGEPTFTGDTKHGGRDTYALWNCTVPRNLEMLKMRVVPEALPSTNRASVDYNHGGMTESGMATAHTPATPFKMLFASDQNTAGQFCPWDRHASKWRYGFMYKFRSDNCSPTAKNNVKWDTGVRFIPDHTGRKLIIAATAPNNDDGITTVACGNGHGVQGNCPGKLDDDQCYFAQNRDHRTAMDAHLFSKTQHMCMTVFDRVPYYPNLPPSRLRKMLLITPLLTQVNLLALVELQAITGKRSTCAEFDVAARSWVGSFSTVKALYKGLPQDGDDMLWLPALEKQMATLLQKPNCMAAAKVLRKVALKRASQFVTAGNPSGQSLAYRRPLHLPSAMGYQQQQQQVAYVAPVPQQQQVAYVEPNPQQQQVAYVAHVPQQQQQQQVYAY